MSGTGFTDWMDLGVFPLQDHHYGVPIEIRQALVGGRISRLQDPADGSSPETSLLEYGREDDMGTLGDVHPWLFWQTTDRSERGMGAWSMAFAGITVEGSKKKNTGGPITPGGTTPRDSESGPSSVLPIKSGRVSIDGRFTEKAPGWPACFPALPYGTTVMVMPGTEESAQHEVMLHADPRLIAVNVEGPGDAGTLVVDLQPEREPCMGEKPGIGGRAARLQSMMRVVAIPKGGIPALGVNDGNAIAWQLAASGVDNLAGYGLVYAKMDGGGGGPITQGASRGTVGGIGVVGFSENGGSGSHERDGDTPCDFGKFSAKQKGGHGLALMAHSGGFGPFHAGSINDKHQIGQDADGHKINSGHIAADGYFYLNATKDGPLYFEDTDYPKPPKMPLISRVHLGWDKDLQHNWLRGSKQGKWRWWAEVPYVVPTTGRTTPIFDPGRTPRGGGPRTGGPGPPGFGPPTVPRNPRVTPPKGPITPPRFGQPTTPRNPGTTGPTTGGTGTPGFGGVVVRGGVAQFPWSTGGQGNEPAPRGGGDPSTAIEKVGNTTPEDVSLFSIHHPMMETFTELGFRPQLSVDGLTSFTHNPEADSDEIRDDEVTRPQVLAMRSWGAQNSSGEWSYVESPDQARARGGTASGGILFTPPAYETEDYLAINSAENVRTISTESFVAVAPGVGFGLGLPSSIGGMAVKAVVLAQTPTGNDPLTIYQLDSSGVAQELFGGQVDQGTGEVVVSAGAGGNQALRLPRGTAAQRPATLAPTGGEIRCKTDGGTDVIEFYDFQNTTWSTLAVGVGSTTFIGLTDTPANFTSSALKIARVNAGETALEFVTPAAGDLLADGTVPMSAAWNFGAQELQNVSGIHVGATGAPDELLEVATVTAGEGAHIGAAFVGNWIQSSTYAMWGHHDVKGTGTSYALLQQSDGTTYLNAAIGKSLYLRINNTTIATVAAASVTLAQPLAMGSNKITGLTAGTGAGEAVEVSSAVSTFMPFVGGTFTSNVIWTDGSQIRLGTGGDSTIAYDGTNTTWNPAAVGSGYLRVNSDIGVDTVPSAKLHVDQSSATGAKPVLILDQADVDQNFINLIGSSHASTSANSFVDASVLTSPGTLTGWIRISIQDDASNISDGTYFIPFYTAPIA